jgi:HEAT repeat protein
MTTNTRAFALCVSLVVAAGCGSGKTELLSVKGQPVEHWLRELKRPEPKARLAAVSALQSVGAVDPKAIPALAGELDDKDAKVRNAATLALLNIGPPAKAAASALTKAKGDKDATVRTHAEAALKRIEAGA